MINTAKGLGLKEKWDKAFFPFKEYTEAIKNILFPSFCFCCARKTTGGQLCALCREKIEFLLPPTCSVCSLPIEDNKTRRCKQCLLKNPPYHRLLSSTAYTGPVQKLIHLFKYHHCDYLADELSLLMLQHLLKIGFNPSGYDFLTAVPLHPLKRKIRGYNQAQLLGEKIANYFKIPFRNDIIYEIKNKPSQTNLGSAKREDNVKGVYQVKQSVQDKKIIIIDDIFTTGATLNACCQELKEQGTVTITALTLSKTI